MSVVNRKKKLSALLAASLLSINFVCASDAYKNNVVDVRVNKESGDSVKVTIYTDRPYTEPVVVNKKANNKYVILMPETKSTLKSAPAVTNGSGTISNVSVNTQSVAGGKGYTKIIITSEKAITVVPRTQQLVSSKPAVQKPASAQTTATKPKTVKTEPKKTVSTPAAKPKPVENVQPPKTVSTPKPVTAPKTAQTTTSSKQPIEILEQEVKTGQYANIPPDKNDDILNKEISNNLGDKQNQEIVQNPEVNTSVIKNIKSVLRGYKNISLWKLLLLAGAITFPVIVIMIILTMDKKINKKIDKTFKREEDDGVDYIPQETVGLNDVNHQEQSVYNSFDDMLNEVDTTDTYENYNLSESVFDEISQPVVDSVSEEGYNNDFEVDDFNTETEAVETVEPDLSDVVPVDVSEPEQEIEADSSEQSPIDEIVPEEPQLPAEPYNPDGYLSDYSGVSDKDFFDELVMQTMADNNRDGLPQESPADEVFNYMNSDKENTSSLSDSSVNSESLISDPVQEFINQPAELPKEEPQESGVQTYVNGDDELTMLTEVKLNDSAGMYLVNYDNFSSLVGHINDDYFVIKKFDEIVSGRIFLKETEKLKNSKRYLVRVGKNKMVVEVSDTSMDRLLDL